MAAGKSERPISVLVRPDLDAVLRARAAANHRSLTKEVVFLIETALGVSSDNVREAIHLFYKANAEVTDQSTSQPA
jgi:plasmid stability protein